MWPFSSKAERLEKKKDIAGLILLLQEPDHTTASSAQQPLIRLGAESVGPLCGLLETSTGDLQTAIMKILGYIHDPRAVKPICHILVKDRDHERQRVAIGVLEQIGGTEVINILTVLARKSKDWPLRKLAIRSLKYISSIKDPDLQSLAAVEDHDWNKAAALGSSAIPALCAAINDEEETIQINAAETLGKIQDPQIIPLLGQVLKQRKTPADNSLRWGCVRGLGKTKRPEAVEVLCEALRDDYLAVRQEAAVALGTIGDSRAMEALCEALKDGNLYLRIYAVEALGNIGDRRVVPMLEQYRETKNWSLRKAAGEALVKLGADSGKVIVEQVEKEKLRVGEYQARAREIILSGKAVCGGCKTRLLSFGGAQRIQASTFKTHFNPLDLEGSIKASMGSHDNQTPFGFCGQGCGQVFCMVCTIKMAICGCGSEIWKF